VIDVRVREQHHVHVAEARIRFVDRAARVVEDPDAGGVLEQQRAVVAAQLAGKHPERRDLDEPGGTLRTT
jgi:hypothetical protein